jgi:uncharacterized protein (TIGR02996 family)
MSEPLSLTDEYVYRVAPDGKSVQAAADLVRRGAFSRPRISAGGARLEALCQGSERRPYAVQVDLADPDRPQTGCNCVSPKRPCKHALGLLLLAARSPEAFEQDASDEPRKQLDLRGAKARATPVEKRRRPTDLREALLQAVLAEPEEDAPRLVYADWLDEHGEGHEDSARAELIRVQVELARAGGKGPHARELRAREKELWEAHREAWLAHLPAHLRHRDVRFQRGFLEELHLTRLPAASWAKHGTKLFGQNPIYRVRLSGTVDRHEVGDLVVIPHLSRVRELSLEGCRFREPMKTLQILFNSPFLSGVTRLVLRDAQLSSRELAALVESPLLARLRELDLADSDVGPKGAELLAGSPQAASLRVLSLANDPIGDAGAKALAASPHLDALEWLDLRGVALGEKAAADLRQRFGERALLG